MNKNAMWLVIFAIMLGIGVVGSYITVPGTHWVSEKVPVYEKGAIFDADNNEIGYIMLPVDTKTVGHWTTSINRVIMMDISVILTAIGCAGTVYNAAWLKGWKPDDC